MQTSLQGLLQINATFKSTEPRVERVLEILDSDQRVVERPGARDLPEAIRPLTVQFDRVTFGYESGREPVLREIDLKIEPGEAVALVGATGAGKSTLAALLPRLLDPWSGAVRIGCDADLHDLRDLTLASVRAAIAVVPQEPFLLPLSVRANIAYADPEADLARVQLAARAAGAEEFIEALPEGYETILGERGCTLSAGQRQRIAIARALLKDAPILVLDEPTAALDASTERRVVDALRELMRGRTCLVIAHRLSTIRHADRIVVLDDGRIIEQGTHQQLMASGGIYQHMHALQFAEAPAEMVEA